MWAVESGSVETVSKLLSSGAKITIKEAHCGRTAVHLAARSGTLDVLKCLVESVKDKEDRIDMINQPDFNVSTRDLAHNTPHPHPFSKKKEEEENFFFTCPPCLTTSSFFNS